MGIGLSRAKYGSACGAASRGSRSGSRLHRIRVAQLSHAPAAEDRAIAGAKETQPVRCQKSVIVLPMALTPPRSWYRNAPEKWAPFRSIPIKRLSRLFLAVFFLFGIFGFFGDLMAGGRTAYPAVLASALYSGITAAVWIIVIARRPRYGLFLLILAQGPLIWFGSHLTNLLQNHFHLQPMPPSAGIPFAAIGSVTVVMISYFFFISFIRNEGRESYRIRNELELAHGI